MPLDDAWDWPLLLYIGTVMLKMSESKFWRTTPRKFQALLAVHNDLENAKNSDGKSNDSQRGKTHYIDEII